MPTTMVQLRTNTPRMSAPRSRAKIVCATNPNRRPKTLPVKAKPAPLVTWERYCFCSSWMGPDRFSSVTVIPRETALDRWSELRAAVPRAADKRLQS